GPVAQLAQHLADVAGEEGRVPDAVQLGVLDRAGDRLLRDLDAPDGEGVARQREPDRTDTAVQVVHGLAPGEPGLGPGERVEPFGHPRVRLQERVGANAEPQAADLFLDRILAPEQLGWEVRDLGRRVVHRPLDRTHLRERGQDLDQPLAVEALAFVRHELYQSLTGVPAFADDQVSQVALSCRLVIRGQPLLARPVAHRVADAVAEVGR